MDWPIIKKLLVVLCESYAPVKESDRNRKDEMARLRLRLRFCESIGETGLNII